MRNVFLGTSSFASAVLERLAASEHAPQLVVTRPDRPRGRGRRLESPPVAATARALGLELLQPEELHSAETLAAIAVAEPRALTVCAYGGLIREPLLSAYEPVNVHPSLLPRWRGAAPIERALMAGDEDTGVSIMRLVAELDAGPVYRRAREPIAAGDDFGSLSARLQARAGEELVAVLDELPEPEPQPAEGVTYAEKIGPRDRDIDFRRPAQVEERRVRALRPHVGARLVLGEGDALGIVAAQVVDTADAPGSLEDRDGRLVLSCGEGGLELTEVQPPGGRPMAAGDWLRGRGARYAGRSVTLAAGSGP